MKSDLRVITTHTEPQFPQRMITVHNMHSFTCLGCGHTEWIEHKRLTFATILNRATLHNIRAHRDGYLITDERCGTSNVKRSIQRSMEQYQASQEAYQQATGTPNESIH